MEFFAPGFMLRAWRSNDESSLMAHANNRNVWVNLRSRFPHPYTQADAEAWIERCRKNPDSDVQLAIVVDGEAVGGIGVKAEGGQTRRFGEIGYWLGEAHWSKGIATEAVRLVTPHAFEKLAVQRIQATVRESNPASARVLEKAGYRVVGRLRRSGRRPSSKVVEFVYAKDRDQPHLPRAGEAFSTDAVS